MTNQAKNNNLHYLIAPILTIVNKLIILSFENENDRTSFSKNYVPHVQIKDFNVYIDGDVDLFDTPLKNDEEKYEQII